MPGLLEATRALTPRPLATDVRFAPSLAVSQRPSPNVLREMTGLAGALDALATNRERREVLKLQRKEAEKGIARQEQYEGILGQYTRPDPVTGRLDVDRPGLLGALAGTPGLASKAYELDAQFAQQDMAQRQAQQAATEKATTAVANAIAGVMRYPEAARPGIWKQLFPRLEATYGIDVNDQWDEREARLYGLLSPESQDLALKRNRTRAETQKIQAEIADIQQGTLIAPEKLNLEERKVRVQEREARLKERQATQTANVWSKDRATLRLKIRGSIRQEPSFKDLQAMQLAINNIDLGAKEHNSAGDIALLNGFVRLTDPGSVVRPSEFETVRTAQGVVDRIRTLAARFQQGDQLSPDMRRRIRTMAIKIFNEAEKRVNAEVQQIFAPVATDAGIPLRDVYKPSDLSKELRLHDLPAPAGTTKNPLPPSTAGGAATEQDIQDTMQELSWTREQVLQEMERRGITINPGE